MAASLTYADWAQRLCRNFFRPERAQQPVTFFVDDELLGRLEGSGDPDQGVQSLTTALRSRLASDSYGRRFNGIDRECHLWKVKGADGCPPSLPLLAVAVLAATRMARENGIAAHNYWRRFRDVLGFEQHDLKGINDVLPGLWNQLTWWLDEHQAGELGRSTVQEDPWWTIIGFALSQALFRESDRQHLTDLFRKIGLAPGEEPNPRELLQYFKAWAPASPLSPGARHMAADARYDDRLTAILVDEASRWDGVLRDERGRKLASLVLAYEPLPRPSYAFVAERPHGFPEHANFRADGSSIGLTAAVEGWYGETLDVDPRWLKNGLRLEHGEFVLSYRPSPIVPLAQNTVLGCWASVSRVEPGEKYCVLLDGAYAEDVEQFLHDHARDEWKREAAGFAPPGWMLLTGVVIEESLPEIPAGPLAVLAPKLRERPTLKGGLLLDSSVDLYLCGGEPDLWLPSLFDESTRVSVDGVVVIEVRAGQRVALAELRLASGSHEVAVGEAVLRFATTRELRDRTPPGSGTLGQILARQDGGYAAVSAGARRLPAAQASGTVAVAGAHLVGTHSDLPSSRPTILLPLNGRRYWLAGPKPGEFSHPQKPARPQWMERAGHGSLYPIGFEVSPHFDVVWILVEHAGRISGRLRHAVPPDLGHVRASIAINEWCRIFELDPELGDEEQALWLRYREAAAALPKLTPEELAREREKQEPSSPAAKRQKAARVEPRRELVIPKLLRLPLKYRSAEKHVYESREKRFQVTYWPLARHWTATERRDEKSAKTIRLGRFRTEEQALAAVKKAIYTIRTVKRKGSR